MDRHHGLSVPQGSGDKKMLPLDRIATANPCLGEFGACPLFQEVMARLTAGAASAGTGVPPVHVSMMARKEGPR